jgi:hypothetical protein
MNLYSKIIFMIGSFSGHAGSDHARDAWERGMAGPQVGVHASKYSVCVMDFTSARFDQIRAYAADAPMRQPRTL